MKRKPQKLTTRRYRAGRMQFIRDQARKQQSAKQAAAQLEFLELGREKPR